MYPRLYLFAMTVHSHRNCSKFIFVKGK